MTTIVEKVKSMTQAYRDQHGPEALRPHQKKPLSSPVVIKLGSINTCSFRGKPWDWTSLLGTSWHACVHLLAQTGMRKAEVALAPGDQWALKHLSLANLTWRIDGVDVAHTDITWEMIEHLKEGDYAVLVPPPSKADQFGIKWGSKPIYLPFSNDDEICAARALQQLELKRRVRGQARRLTPMFIDDTGGAWTKATVDSIFKTFMIEIVGEQQAKCYSVHSFRIYLCCALAEAGESDKDILALLRWSSDDAMNTYKLYTDATYAAKLRGAAKASVTGTRGCMLGLDGMPLNPRTGNRLPVMTADEMVACLAEANGRMAEQATEEDHLLAEAMANHWR